MVTVEKPAITPERSLKPAGYKRVRSDLIHVIYESEKGERMMVPLAKGENSDVFNARRQKTVDMLYDPTRKLAYCQFEDRVVNVVVQDSRWILYRESMRQQWYHFMHVIQLVVTRLTCAQQDKYMACRNCQNPQFRAGCLTPIKLFYIMPLKGKSPDLCTKMVANFDPLVMDTNPNEWKVKMPAQCVRVRRL